MPLPATRGRSFRAKIQGQVQRLQAIATGASALLQMQGDIDRELGTSNNADEQRRAVLRRLGLGLDLPAGDLSRIPAQGPLLVTAELPTGAMDAILLLNMLRSIRNDVRIVAGSWLTEASGLQQLVIHRNAHGTSADGRQALRELTQHLRSGGCVLAFPANRIAQRPPHGRKAVEQPWHRALAWLQRRTHAPVVPVHVSGRRPAWFELADWLLPKFAERMLPRLLLAQRGATIRVRIGHPVPARQLDRFDDDSARAAYLQLRAQILSRRTAAPQLATQLPSRRRTMALLAEPMERNQLAQEIADLPPSALLTQSGPMQVFIAKAEDIPLALLEIGRLRELTFRGVGEGSGKQRDLDRFDEQYLHLFTWDRDQQEIVGAYRLGTTDQPSAQGGQSQLYTASLYRYSPDFLAQLGPAIELGRSFIQPKYQRGHLPLLMLWRGIGAFVARNPRYRRMFGTVSISADHHATSVRLMVDHLLGHCSDASLQAMVSPLRPFRARFHERRSVRWQPQQISSLDDVAGMVRDLEVDRQGVPVLMARYLELGARVVGINVDPEFHTIDALMVVDLLAAPRHLQVRYLGEAGAAAVRAEHGADEPKLDPLTAVA
jgi:putative hemolysin